jgi:hypothetical protein
MGAPPSDSGGVQDRSQWPGPQSRIFGRPGCVGSSKVDNNSKQLLNYTNKGVKSKTRGLARLLIVAEWSWNAMQRTNTKNSKKNIPQNRNFTATVPISIFMCLCAIYKFPRLTCFRKYADRSWEYINRSQTHERGN